jgi:REP element-mobilizing transposase RayT
MSPYRLHRLDFVFTRHPLYFVTACTDQRQHLLASKDALQSFQMFSRKAGARGVYVGRYVLMPDHLHVFVAFAPDAIPLGAWMKSLKNALSKILRQKGVAGPHWQKGFFDHVLRSKESFSQKWAYVRLNPVRAGLVSRAEDWPFQGEIWPLALQQENRRS